MPWLPPRRTRPGARRSRLLAETETSCAQTIRVNGADTEHFDADLRGDPRLDLDAIVLPKATPDAVEALGRSACP